MKPKEKAKELVDEFDKYSRIYPSFDGGGFNLVNDAKQCALISVNEILNIDNVKPYILHKEIIKYYIEVKQEIEKL